MTHVGLCGVERERGLQFPNRLADSLLLQQRLPECVMRFRVIGLGCDHLPLQRNTIVDFLLTQKNESQVVSRAHISRVRVQLGTKFAFCLVHRATFHAQHSEIKAGRNSMWIELLSGPHCPVV